MARDRNSSSVDRKVRRQTGFQTSRGIRYVWPLALVLVLFGWSLGDFLADVLGSDDPVARLFGPVERMYRSFFNYFSSMPLWLAFGIAALFALQVFFPVQKGTRGFSVFVRVDAIWTLFSRLFIPLLSTIFLAFLRGLYDSYFSFINISTTFQLSALSEIVVGYLLIDFLGWFHHFVRHKVPVFWEFHAVHHSQTNMNPFSNNRVHPMDWMTANTIKFLPAFFFANSLNVALAYISIHRLLDHLNHSNVRTNLGPLRFFLVTPQSHRVHHSSMKELYDKNFGVSTSIWDHLFRTQHCDYEIYPPTGIPDRLYPMEVEGTKWVRGALSSWWLQLVYPFKVVFEKTLTRAPSI